jgi:hypothetical protein
MPPNQESFLQAGLIIEFVVADLEGATLLGIPMWETET